MTSKGVILSSNQILSNATTVVVGSARASYRGGFSIETIKDLVEAIQADEAKGSFVLARFDEFSRVHGSCACFYLIIETPSFTYAATDHLRSLPLLIDHRAKCIDIHDSGLHLAYKFEEIAKDALCEFSLANYVTGSETLINKVYAVPAGSVAIYEKKRDLLRIESYVRYLPDSCDSEILSYDFLCKLNATTEQVFSALALRAQSKSIVVPLSGGLDSRFVLSALKNYGVRRIKTFTYGTRYNTDVKNARKVAERLGVAWVYVDYEHKDYYRFRRSEIVKRYFAYAHNFTSLPFMSDEFAVYSLIKSGYIVPGETIFVNGQSGDFTSGGHLFGRHLPDIKIGGSYTFSELASSIRCKHFTNRKIGLEEKFLVDSRIAKCLSINAKESMSGKQLLNWYECWEASERQAKYVINGQRAYEYFNCQWSLPLWDRRFFDIWRTAPIEFKLHQKSYLKFLSQYDYCGVFSQIPRSVEVFNKKNPLIFVVPRALGLVFGSRTKRFAYSFLSYWGKYSHHYKQFGIWQHLKNLMSGSNVLKNYNDQYLKKLNSHFN
jgi:asparagine synthase (glutamine-hydrolysing)